MINTLLVVFNSSTNFAFYCGDVVFRECLSAMDWTTGLRRRGKGADGGGGDGPGGNGGGRRRRHHNNNGGEVMLIACAFSLQHSEHTRGQTF